VVTVGPVHSEFPLVERLEVTGLVVRDLSMLDVAAHGSGGKSGIVDGVESFAFALNVVRGSGVRAIVLAIELLGRVESLDLTGGLDLTGESEPFEKAKVDWDVVSLSSNDDSSGVL